MTVPDRSRRYAASSAAYAQAQQALAAGVSSNFRLGMDPVPLFFDRGGGRAPHRRRRQRLRRLRAGHGARRSSATHRRRSSRRCATQLGRGQLFAGQTARRARARRAVPGAGPVRGARPLRQLGHRDGPGRAPPGARRHRPPGHRQVRGPLPRLARPAPRQHRRRRSTSPGPADAPTPTCRAPARSRSRSTTSRPAVERPRRRCAALLTGPDRERDRRRDHGADPLQHLGDPAGARVPGDGPRADGGQRHAC